MSLTSKVAVWLESEECQEQIKALKAAGSLAQMVCIALQIGLLMGRRILEDELYERAKEQQKWPDCPKCGKRLNSKGWQVRQIQTLVGIIH